MGETSLKVLGMYPGFQDGDRFSLLEKCYQVSVLGGHGIKH